MTADKPARVHLPSVVARLGETEYPDAYGGRTVRLTGPGVITMTIYVVPSSAPAVPLGAATGGAPLSWP